MKNYIIILLIMLFNLRKIYYIIIIINYKIKIKNIVCIPFHPMYKCQSNSIMREMM